MVKFSIIIPVYNAEKYLEQCIESILRQTESNFELILINDGSTDDSKSICEKYSELDKRVTVINKENGGASSARNVGLDHAKGQMIVFIDSDDSIGKHYLELLEFKDDEEFVQCGVKTLENDYLKSIMTHDEIMKDYNRFWLESRQQWPSMCCLSRNVIEKNNLRFNLNLQMGEDGLFNQIYISKCKKIRRIKENEYYYNHDNLNSVSHRFYIDRLEQQLEVISILEKYFTPENLNRMRWDYWHEVLNHYYVKGLKNENKKIVKETKKKIIKTYKNAQFRQCIPYMKSVGSLDEKLEIYFMNYYLHWLYKPLLRLIQLLYRFKSIL